MSKMGDSIGRLSLDSSMSFDRIQLGFNFCKPTFNCPIPSSNRPTSVRSVVLNFWFAMVTIIYTQHTKTHILSSKFTRSLSQNEGLVKLETKAKESGYHPKCIKIKDSTYFALFEWLNVLRHWGPYYLLAYNLKISSKKRGKRFYAW